VGDRLTQLDINSKNLVYISNGSGTEESLTLSARDRAGASLDPFNISISIL
tara:strand:- start:236 stop:388 length:153 start_codon:yes stop_codon:yes gene_type:complete